jgi:dynein light intermediate chain
MLRAYHSVDEQSNAASEIIVRPPPATVMDSTRTLLKYESPRRLEHRRIAALTTASEQPLSDAQIFSSLFPNNSFEQNGLKWTQEVSRAPSTGGDVLALGKKLAERLRSQAEHSDKSIGDEPSSASATRASVEPIICPQRQKFYSQCFDEILRQVAVDCIERGALMLRVRDGLRMGLLGLRNRYESCLTVELQRTRANEQAKILSLHRDLKVLRRTKLRLHEECQCTIKRERQKMAELKSKHLREEQRLQDENEKILREIEVLVADKLKRSLTLKQSLAQCAQNAREASYTERRRQRRPYMTTSSTVSPQALQPLPPASALGYYGITHKASHPGRH